MFGNEFELAGPTLLPKNSNPFRSFEQNVETFRTNLTNFVSLSKFGLLSRECDPRKKLRNPENRKIKKKTLQEVVMLNKNIRINKKKIKIKLKLKLKNVIEARRGQIFWGIGAGVS